MKTIYKLLILGMVYLLSNTTYAQIVQYSDDGTKSCIDCEEKSTETIESCFCLGIVQLGYFNFYIPTQNNTVKEEWLRNQERLLAEEMGGDAQQNFNDVQMGYFRGVETNDLAKDYFGKISQRLLDVTGHDANKLSSATMSSSILKYRKEVGVPNNALYGDLKFKGKYLRDMSDGEVVFENLKQTQLRNAQRDAFNNYIVSNAKLGWSKNNDIIEKQLAQLYINHYNNLDYEDAIRFMTRYIVAINEKNLSILYQSFGNSENIASLTDHDYTSYLTDIVLSGEAVPYTLPSYVERPIDQTLFRYALNDQSSTFRSWVDSRDQVSAKLKKYYENNTYDQDALTESANLINANIKGQPFVTADSNYSHFRGYPLSDPIQSLLDDVYQTQYRKNLLRTWHIQPSRVENLGMSGFFNLVETIQGSGNLHANTKGSMIRQAFKVLHITPQWTSYTNADLAALFNLSSSSTSVNDVHWAHINYNFDIGRIMYDRGIRTADFLQSDLAFEAAMAITRNDMSTAEHYLKVYDLTKDLQLNQAQTDWLVEHSLNIDEINSFLLNNNSEEAKEFLKQAIDILIAQQSVTTLNEVFEYLVNRNEIFYVDVANTPKVNPKKETKCFDVTKPAKITIFVEQNIEGSREITANIGHTFIGIEQGNISRYLGFYPDNPHATLFTDQDAEIHDNSKSKYHVSISTEVTPDQLKRIINDINNFPDTYSLNNYNCSDFGIQIARKAGLNLPRTVGEYGVFPIKFKGRNPADLGEDIRAMNSTPTITIDKKGGNAPEKKGDC